MICNVFLPSSDSASTQQVDPALTLMHNLISKFHISHSQRIASHLFQHTPYVPSISPTHTWISVYSNTSFPSKSIDIQWIFYKFLSGQPDHCINYIPKCFAYVSNFIIRFNMCTNKWVKLINWYSTCKFILYCSPYIHRPIYTIDLSMY